jgi:neutral ceramidase
MTVVRIVDTNGADVGSIAWFPVHCTSMNNTNELISADNKGYASYLFERYKNGNTTLFGDGAFVAAFGQANEGDVSPNTQGAKCPDGTPCAMNSSTCNGRNEECIARGPGKDMFESTKIIGTLQFNAAKTLYESAKTPITGTIKYRHMFVDMTNFTVVDNGNFIGKTWQGAMGYSFAAGTTDGPGAFNFTQGDNNTSNPFWNFLAGFIAKPTPEQIACQHPKPILLDVGQTEPVPWTPDVVPVQIVTVGKLVMLAVPGEFSTMSGRRLRATVRSVFEAAGINDTIIVVAGLSNTYTGYITTYEEYEVQRYEGASTIYGPYTLQAYQQLFTQLATAIVKDTPVPPGPTPRDLSHSVISFIPPVVLDTGSFGKVNIDVHSTYKAGDTVEVVFFGANPRNNLLTGATFLTVEKLEEDGKTWTVMLTDADWDTKFIWKRHGVSESLITIQWAISEGTPAGKYRIQHFGYHKSDPFTPTTKPYSGVSSVFAVM